MNFEFVGQPFGLLRLKRLIKARDVVRVQIVHHQTKQLPAKAGSCLVMGQNAKLAYEFCQGTSNDLNVRKRLP
jgi:hypothetical protein